MDNIEWEATEFDYYERGSLWYMGVTLIAGLLLLLSLWQEDFMLAIVVVLGTAVIIALGHKKPRTVDIKIDDKNIMTSDGHSYSINSLKAFAICEGGQNDPEWGKILLQSKHWFQPLAKLPVPQIKIASARELLNRYLKEVECEPSLADEIFKRLKL